MSFTPSPVFNGDVTGPRRASIVSRITLDNGSPIATLAALRTALNIPTGNFSGSYGDLTNKPTSFPPSAHAHVIADVNGLQAALNAKQNTITLGSTSQYFRGDLSLASPVVTTPTRALNTIYQVTAPMGADVTASIKVQITITALLGSTGDAILEVSPNADMSNAIERGRTGMGSLLGLGLTINGTGQVSGYVPANWYYRYRTLSTGATPTYTIIGTPTEVAR